MYDGYVIVISSLGTRMLGISCQHPVFTSLVRRVYICLVIEQSKWKSSTGLSNEEIMNVEGL
jgi:hypothetical protein